MKNKIFIVLWILVMGAGLKLGFWQLDRLAWKENWIAQIDAAYENPVLSFPSDSPLPDIFFTRGITRIDYHPKDVLWVKPRVLNGVFGAHQWMRATIQGQSVWVNRGFVPEKDLFIPRELRRETRMVQVRPHGLTPAVLRSMNPRVDPDLYARARAGLVVVLEPIPGRSESITPVGERPVLRNSHLAYAIFWFSMSLIAAVGGAWFLIEQRRHRLMHTGPH